MTVNRCVFLIERGSYPRCTNTPEWVFVEGDGPRKYVCERHLPDLERSSPDALILPLDTDNQR